jgi:hypothetical protein
MLAPSALVRCFSGLESGKINSLILITFVASASVIKAFYGSLRCYWAIYSGKQRDLSLYFAVPVSNNRGFLWLFDDLFAVFSREEERKQRRPIPLSFPSLSLARPCATAVRFSKLRCSTAPSFN